MSKYDFDEGSEGSAEGPFLNWHARETLDGSIGSRSFSIRTPDGRGDITPKMEKGVMFDLSSLKTGWFFTTGTVGQAPEIIWNEAYNKMGAQPAARGEDRWKKGFSVRVALTKDKAATWSQSGQGAWMGIANLMKAVQADGGDGETVVAKFAGVDEVKFAKGGTSAPQFEVVKWAARPECLEAKEPEPTPEPAPTEETAAFADDEF